MRKNKVDIITLGCSKNLVDSEQLMRQFVANGYKVEHDPHKINGEIVVVNTWANALQGNDEGKAPFTGIWTNGKYRRASKDLLPSGLTSPIMISK